MKDEDILKLETGDIVYVTLYETGKNCKPKIKLPPVKCVVRVNTTNHDGDVTLTSLTWNIDGLDNHPVDLVSYDNNTYEINRTKYKFYLTVAEAIKSYNKMIDTTHKQLEQHFNKLSKRLMKDKVALRT